MYKRRNNKYFIFFFKYKKIFKYIKEEKIKNIEINQGTFKTKDIIAPTYINLRNPKFLEIDDYYYSGLIIVNYYKEYDELLLKSLIEANLNMNISIFYEKGDTLKILKILTYNIGNVGVEIKGGN